MVLPIASPRPIDAALSNPDFLPVPNSVQGALRREKAFGEGTIVGALTKFVTDPDAGKDNLFIPFSERTQEETEQLITPEEANKQFGIKGRLDFKTPVSVEGALKRKQSVERQMIIEEQVQIADEQNTLGDKVKFFFTADVIGQAVDLPFYAILGPELGAARALGLSRMIGSKTIANAVTSNPVARSAIRSGIERGFIGGAETVVAQPFIKSNYDYFGLDYGIEDAVTDVLFGAGLDVGINSIGVGLQLKKAVSKAQYRNQAFRDSVTDMRTIFGVAEQQMRSENSSLPNLIESVIKLDQSNNLRAIDDGNIYHSDFIYRQDFSNLDPDTIASVNERLHTETLIPQDRIQSSSRIVELAEKQPHRIKSFSDLHQDIISKSDLGSKTIKYSDFFDSLKALVNLNNLSKTQFRAVLKNDFGLDITSNRDLVDINKAIDIANQIQNNTDINLRKTNATTEDLLPTLSKLKARLKELPSLANLKSKEFIERFKRARFKVENDPSINKVTLKDFEKLTPEKQADILDYLQFLQEGNIQRSEIDELLSGNKQVFENIKSRIEWNRTVVDNLTTDQAYNNVRKALETIANDRPDKFLLEPIEDIPGIVDDAFIQEQIDINTKYLTEEELDMITKEQIIEDKLIDDFAEAQDLVTRCVMRGGIV